MDDKSIICISPFEQPDSDFVMAVTANGGFGVLHLGRDPEVARQMVGVLSERLDGNFGVCFAQDHVFPIELTDKVTMVILPADAASEHSNDERDNIYQVTSPQQAQILKEKGITRWVAKGTEAGGAVSEMSSFILLQSLLKSTPEAKVWVQGGVGLHTGPALLTAGACGVILDSQLALFKDLRCSEQRRRTLSGLNGSETILVEGHRILLMKHSKDLKEGQTVEEIRKQNNSDSNVLYAGQDVAFAQDYANRFQSLSHFLETLSRGIHSRARQALSFNALAPGNRFSNTYQVSYPIVAGPMTRVSDIPEFIGAIAHAGALPFFALSLMRKDKAIELLKETSKKVNGKSWGIGMLGFAPPDLWAEQIECVKEIKPPLALIAGGRPSQTKVLEEIGVKTFLHVPSPGLLDMYLKEGVRRFVFEGRECGGHVGPLYSLILWEQQIQRLLQFEDLYNVSVLFAGGIHDARSAAMIAILAAPLMARGVKVGVLMGSAYLYTHEAVSTGAIVEDFQQQAVNHEHTVLLETAPGHETRCLKTGYVDFFDQQKRRLSRQSNDIKKVWSELETLNVGRLRIATKGVERINDQLVTIDQDTRLRQGMYMVGQVASLRQTLISMEELHQAVSLGSKKLLKHHNKRIKPLSKNSSRIAKSSSTLDIAIVGMACILPGARNIDEYWLNILTAKNSITEVSDDRWNKQTFFTESRNNQQDKTLSKWGGFIPKVEFDPVEYGIPPQSMTSIDTAQLLSLQVVKEALNDADLNVGEFNSENTSVIFGVEGGHELSVAYNFRAYFQQVFGELPESLQKILPEMTEDSFPGILANVISGRIANRFNFGGANYTVDAACASSLTAVQKACDELTLRRSDLVIAGGADLHNSIVDYLLFSSTKALAPSGQCKTFDASADGIVLGEGIAAIVLKRYEDAQREGDRVYARIRGIGSSSDGKAMGLTAPRRAGQVRALHRAYEQAAISPAEVSLFEAHGTGTVVGDKTELRAATELLQDAGAVAGQTYLGSVKTQIGHTKCAAGMAGLIKAALSIHHSVIPPTLNLKTPNAFYQAEISPFRFVDQAGKWLEKNKIAGISAFGFGGTNFHTVLSQSESNLRTAATSSQTWPAEILCLRAETSANLTTVIQEILTFIRVNPNVALKDLAYTLAMNDKDQEIHYVIVAENIKALEAQLEAILGKDESIDGIYPVSAIEGKVAYLFPGQGSQYLNMFREMMVFFPQMSELLSSHPEYYSIIYPDKVFDDKMKNSQNQQLIDTMNAQISLGIVEFAMATLFHEWGMSPDMLLGHSYGELAALVFANAMNKNDLISVSKARAQSIISAVGEDRGSMLAVKADEQKIHELREYSSLCVANHNSPQQWVLAGETSAIEKATQWCRQQGVAVTELPVYCAFHSPLIQDAQHNFFKALKNINIETPKIPIWSNTSATLYPNEPKEIRQRLADHIISPVRFVEEIEAVHQAGANIFIEIGPGNVLSGLVNTILEGKAHHVKTKCIYSNQKNQSAVCCFLEAVASYLATGREINWQAYFAERRVKKLELTSKRSKTLWLVDGHRSVPVDDGHDAKNSLQSLITPIALNSQIPEKPISSVVSEERVITEYLNNVREMINAQRDVVVNYLGSQTNLQPVPQPGRLQTTSPPEKVEYDQHQNGVSDQASSDQLLNIDRLLFSIVSEKTGYPQDMLALDQDLEADLSIDSIKRMEIIGMLQEQLSEVIDPNEQEALLNSLSNLRNLTEWTKEIKKAISVDSAVLEKTSIDNVISSECEQNTLNHFSESDIEKILFTTISDKTGYPTDMLDLDQDLEADLSIDSIKRVEIVGELRHQLPGLNEVNNDAVMEELSSCVSLQSMKHIILQHIVKEDSHPQSLSKPSILSSEEKSQNNVIRYQRVMSLTPLNSDIQSFSEFGFYNDSIAIAIDECDRDSPIIESLQTAKININLIDSKTDLAEIKHLVYFDLYGRRKAEQGVLELLNLVQRCNHSVLKTLIVIYGNASLSVHLSKNQSSGIHEKNELTPLTLGVLKQYQGYPGFMNVLSKEWSHTQCRSIGISWDSFIDKDKFSEQKTSPDSIASMICDEINDNNKVSEVVYQNSNRYITQLQPKPLTLNQEKITLNNQSVILVLGGAQGIGAEIVKGLVHRFGCHCVLVGRTAEPNLSDDSLLDQMTELKIIREYFIKQGNYTSPVELENAVQKQLKTNQIRRLLQQLNQPKPYASYISCDVSDVTAMRKLLVDVRSRFGQIDGIIHGAGLLDDKYIERKTSQKFLNVYQVKTVPMQVIAEASLSELKFLALFSSIVSVVGNPGQSDYAAANNVLDHYARQLPNSLVSLSGTRIFSINWGPWQGTGMVTQDVKKALQERGMAFIPMNQGVECFLNELVYGDLSQVVITAQSETSSTSKNEEQFNLVENSYSLDEEGVDDVAC